MVISNVVGQQFAFLFPVGLVIVCSLLFVFGFKSSVEQPNFKQLSSSSDERKSLKRKKLKGNKSQSNGHATVIADDSESKSKALKSSNKGDSNRTKKDVKKESQKSPVKGQKKDEKGSEKENIEPPSKKKKEKIVYDKPSDFDEGEWETAFSRKDKKNRKKEDGGISTPEKTPKKKSGEKKSPKTVEEKNKQNKTPASSPETKKFVEKKDAGVKKSPEKKDTGAVEEKAPSVPNETQQTESQPEKSTDGSGDALPTNEATSAGGNDQGKEESQKQIKKKARKD